MKDVFIRYNPYKLITEIAVNGKALADNNKLAERSANDTRLQEWVEDLPKLLKCEFNDAEFKITFHGTTPDFEDLSSVFTTSNQSGDLTAEIKHIHAKGTDDREKLIEDVFKKIQAGPFEDLRSDDIKHTFKQAQSKDFEVCVVATMSAGKSTLINAMLGTKLMPSAAAACTAIITRIKDTDQTDNHFRAKAFKADDSLVCTHENLTYTDMSDLNSNEDISQVDICGDIPFVSSEDVSLVLIDTPGPDNARNPQHQITLQKHLTSSVKPLILFVMTGTYATSADINLLKSVAESMSNGGKQSKDRFLFVINKLDNLNTEEGENPNKTLGDIRDFLGACDIVNPNLFPAAALPALNLRLMADCDKSIDINAREVTTANTRKLNRTPSLHFETYSPLPPSIKGEIEAQLKDTRSKWTEEGGVEPNNPAEALIHTGIPSIEAAIRQYVQKYAKTAKIKSLVDVFIHKLKEKDVFEKTKIDIAARAEEHKEITAMIDSIKSKVDDTESALRFRHEVDIAVEKIHSNSRDEVEKIKLRYQAKITKEIDKARGAELSMDEARTAADGLAKFARNLEPTVVSELSKLIDDKLVTTGEKLMDAYEDRLTSLSDELNDKQGLSPFRIDPTQLMSDSTQINEFVLEEICRERQVEAGKRFVKNTDKQWYKPWTWFQEDGHYVAVFRTERYISGLELTQAFFAPVQKTLETTCDNALAHAQTQSDNIAEYFKVEFDRLDTLLKKKLDELKTYAKDEDGAKKRLKEAEANLKWLEGIQAEVESILEI